MLMLVSAVKLVAEIALLALIGQWILGLLAGARRDTNFFYQLLSIMTRPFVRGTRLITPRVVVDSHVPLVTFLLLAMTWIVATVARISICVQIGVQACL